MAVKVRTPSLQVYCLSVLSFSLGHDSLNRLAVDTAIHTYYHDVKKNDLKRIGALRNLRHFASSLLSHTNDMALSLALQVEPINARKPHRLQHNHATQYEWIKLPMQRLPT